MRYPGGNARIAAPVVLGLCSAAAIAAALLGSSDRRVVSVSPQAGPCATYVESGTDPGCGVDGNEEGVFARRFDASGTPTGPEFQVNAYTTGHQQFPSVALDRAGNSVVAWESVGQDGSGRGIFAQRHDPSGTPLSAEDLQINTTTSGDQTAPHVAVDRRGNLVTTWQDADAGGTGIFGRRFSSTGAALTREFTVNDHRFDAQIQPSVALGKKAEPMFLWQSLGQDGSSWGIFGRRMSLQGLPLTFDLPVNATTIGAQVFHSQIFGPVTAPSLAGDGKGSFTAVWADEAEDGDTWGVFARRFNATGAALTDEVQVNQFTAGHQGNPTVASDAKGNFVVAWQSDGQDGSFTGVYARRFNASADALGDEFLVNQTTASHQHNPAVGMDKGGNVVAAWQGFDPGRVYGTYVRRFSPTGIALMDEFPVSVYTVRDQGEPAVAVQPDGTFVVAFTDAFRD